MGTNWSESQEDSKESGVSFKSDQSKHGMIDFNKGSHLRVRLKKLLFSGISCVSAERDDSQGRTAHVKDTPPSPTEKPEDLIGADIDSVRDDEDWVKSSYSLMAKGSMESIDSGVSFKSDWSRNHLINFKDRVSPRMAWRSPNSSDFGVSFKSDRSNGRLIDFKDRVSLSRPDFSSSEEEHIVADDEDLVKSSDDLDEMNQELSSEVGWEHR